MQFEKLQQDNVSLSFTTFPGPRESETQDLLLSTSPIGGQKPSICEFIHNEQQVLQCEINPSSVPEITASWLNRAYEIVIAKFNKSILNTLHEHEDHYMNTESIIARYGIQVLRVGSLLDQPQVHIENEALSYLIQTPWRNAHELDYQIARMVFYANGDVLRENYVQRMVYEFGTSTRGISNAHVVKHLIQSFTYDVINRFDFKTASGLFDVQLPPTSIPVPTRFVSDQGKKAA